MSRRISRSEIVYSSATNSVDRSGVIVGPSKIEAGVSTACIVGKSWDYHVTEALGTTLDEGVAMVSDSVEFLRGAGLEVLFDAEHFFDGYKRAPEFSLRVLEGAAEKGATRLVLCDTNGGTLPHEVEQIVGEVVDYFGSDVGVAVHLHDDAGTGVANALAGVRGGAMQVQGTINGVGERCGNANIVSIIANLKLKLGLDVVMTRSTDVVLELQERTAIANKVNADLFVSIHANAHREASLEGVETYFLSSEATDSAARQVAALENEAVQLEQPAARARAEVVRTILWDLAQSEYLYESSRLAEVVQDGRDQRGVGRVVETPVEIIREERHSALLPPVVVGARVLHAGLPVRPDEAKAHWRGPIGGAPHEVGGVLEVREGQPLLWPAVLLGDEPHADGVPRLVLMLGLVRVGAIPAAICPLVYQRHPLERFRSGGGPATQGLGPHAVAKNAHHSPYRADGQGHIDLGATPSRWIGVSNQCHVGGDLGHHRVGVVFDARRRRIAVAFRRQAGRSLFIRDLQRRLLAPPHQAVRGLHHDGEHIRAALVAQQ